MRKVSTAGVPATNAPSPAATTAVAARCPANRPPTAGITVRCRSPAEIAYAQSAPGVITNRKDTALVFVTMRDADRDTVEAFEQAVATIPNVLTAQRLFGDPDYLLQVVARDLRAFQKLYDERISTLPGVQRLSSTLVMKSVVENRPLPL